MPREYDPEEDDGPEADLFRAEVEGMDRAIEALWASLGPPWSQVRLFSFADQREFLIPRHHRKPGGQR